MGFNGALIFRSSSVFKKLKSSHLEVFLRKGVLKICNKFTGQHPCRSVISIKLLCDFIEIAFRHGCSPVNLLHIFRIPFPGNTSTWLLLNFFSTELLYTSSALKSNLYDSGKTLNAQQKTGLLFKKIKTSVFSLRMPTKVCAEILLLNQYNQVIRNSLFKCA